MASKGAGAKKVKDKELTEEFLETLTVQQRKQLRESAYLEDIQLEIKIPGYKSQIYNLSDKLAFPILQRAYETITEVYETAKERFEEREAARKAKEQAQLQKQIEIRQSQLNEKEIKRMQLEAFDPFNEGKKDGAPYFKGPDNKVYKRYPNNFHGPEIGTWNPETEEIEFLPEDEDLRPDDLRPDEYEELRRTSEELRKEQLAQFNPYATEEEALDLDAGAGAGPKIIGAAPKLADKDKEEEDELVLQKFTLRGKKYLRSPQNEVWLLGPGDTMGAWQGIYNPVKDRIIPAPEPDWM